MWNIILILLVHTFADFFCQTSKMGLNKGKDVGWLTTHVAVYSIVTTIFWVIFFDCSDAIIRVFIITFATHWMTDFVTSRLGGWCYLKMVQHTKNKDELITEQGKGTEKLGDVLLIDLIDGQ